MREEETSIEKLIEIQMAKSGIKTRTELAKKINMNRTSLNRGFERNDFKLSTLLDMCKVLNCSLFDLTGK